jgi:ketosteroid isomerase-like protein
MSRRNVEVARKGYEAYNREGPYAILDFLDPQVEWGTPEQDVNPAETFKGHDGVRRFLDQFFEVFEHAEIQPEEFIETGERVLVPFLFKAKARGSGIELEEHWVHVWTLRDGKAVRLDQYTDRGAALEAVGLSE